jgi:hypothetical protein
MWGRALVAILGVCLVNLLGACQATATQIIPTPLPTITQTFTPSPSRTPARNITPTPRPTQAVMVGMVSPTPLLGPTRTSAPSAFATPTPRNLNPNAPRIEFFTSDPLSVEPGKVVTLYWSARGVDNAVIYRLDENGARTQVYNVAPDDSLAIQTRQRDRGELRFVLAIGANDTYIEQPLIIPLQCPVVWFFVPSPTECPSTAPEETQLFDQSFERGRMIYVASRNVIYVLFNDGAQPAWLSFENRYDPAIHPERDPNAPPDFIQPLRQLGYLWRGTETVRNRLGLGLADEIVFDGFIQSAPISNGVESVYVSGADGTVLNMVPDGSTWLIIRP